NAVYIASPPSSHLEHFLAALATGKDIYVEKPVARSSYEARLIAESLKGSSSKLTVAHYRRKMPALLKVKQLLDNHDIGQVRVVDIRILHPAQSEIIAATEYNWRLDPAIPGGGYFWDLAPHQ